ncbi:bifunctional 5,10-methylenetetrahydrofolate dehydrogenase/5,10-methenyltetrahydrofolate cyclohydrolase [Methylosinus sporium]|uniref:Bifunctional protein FolD n=1 Tax=Methylosinus sporium TaxID=428 RepID=A0A2U1SQK5_METSR|nr:bifunctional 5,10-methylenetetrahydrofolate dehydrogenase/5,10-methenyltetrahydrofolate cyclohydrolase [Methylosinus sporium]PWB93892.1 bifunctional 5,10-methylenetetrahydrofolate dehydrogenase/5,10-methenyltetrahydrofolate cyclohydrolase [Methylosinus sporium]
MQKIYSREIVAARKAALVEAIGALRARGVVPKLAAVVCSADPAALSYVAVKRKHAEEVGADFEGVDLSHAGSYGEIAMHMRALCARPDIHGVIVVMSSKPEVDEIDVTNLVPAHKDVDGLSVGNLGALLQNGPHQRFIAPATPRACIALAETQEPLAGKTVVVIGRGRTVGKPLANMLVNAGATVTVCHSATQDIPKFSRAADIVFVATGRPHFFGRDYFSEGQLVVDAGVGFIDGKLAGDVDGAALEGFDIRLTAVPGGVGPLTSVLILENLLALIAHAEAAHRL